MLPVPACALWRADATGVGDRVRVRAPEASVFVTFSHSTTLLAVAWIYTRLWLFLSSKCYKRTHSGDGALLIRVHLTVVEGHADRRCGLRVLARHAAAWLRTVQVQVPWLLMAELRAGAVARSQVRRYLETHGSG